MWMTITGRPWISFARLAAKDVVPLPSTPSTATNRRPGPMALRMSFASARMNYSAIFHDVAISQ